MRLTTILFLVAAIPSTAQIATLTGKASLTGRAQIFPTASCLVAPAACNMLPISSFDPYSTAGSFAGYADATIRKDPQTGTLWMAYSWPHTAAGGSQVVDTHVAYSTDNGKTWSNSGLPNSGVLYPSQVVSNPTTGATNDHTCHEVMNIYPQVVNGVTYWYGIHQSYLVQQGGAGTSNEPTTVRLMMAVAPGTATTGPMGLASATPQYLGSSQNTDANFPAVNLTSISGLSNCTQFREPSLIMSGSNLYLQTSCSDLTSILQFTTPSDPTSVAGNWNWSYVGNFGTHAQAQTLCSYVNGCGQNLYFTQGDIAKASNGSLLMVLSLVYSVGGGGKFSLGCVATELSQLSPPAFKLDSRGRVQVDAVVTSTDSATGGPGSCTFDPSSMTGIIIAHKETNCAAGTAGCSTQGGEFTYLVASGTRPR